MTTRRLLALSSLLCMTACGDAGDASFLVVGEPPASQTNDTVPTDVLTAGVWDDNLNFDWFETYVASTATVAGAPAISPEEQLKAQQRFQDRPPMERLDIALVVDTTSSMDDEIDYLRAEFESLARRIETAHPGAQQRWALIAYGDEGDRYVVQTTDFTDDTSEFIETLRKQKGTAGGDFPEASDQGLDALDTLDWREDKTARLAFWLADAPHHVRHSERMLSAIRIAAQENIHIYPIAASGADELTEYTMRAAAQLSGGRFMFLTDDSGVGEPHREPTIPCFYVTLLSDAVLRVVDVELSGEYRQPAPEQVIRVGGNPMDGQCMLQDGRVAGVF